MARKMISDEEAAALIAGKPTKKHKATPVAKGKLRRAERAHDDELEGKMTDKLVERAKPRDRSTDPTKVGGDVIKAVVSDTLARCYKEIWPGMNTEDEFGNVDLEIQEEAYIVQLTMLVGSDHFTPRRGLKIKEVNGLGDSLPTCKGCS